MAFIVETAQKMRQSRFIIVSANRSTPKLSAFGIWSRD
ncbi:hypothetical protein ABIE49_002485 [Bradyrhizobium sp. OAE829]|jgi:hypothetical protein